MPARLLGESMGENVMVLGCPPLPAWLLSDSRQVQPDLDTDITQFHKLV